MPRHNAGMTNGDNPEGEPERKPEKPKRSGKKSARNGSGKRRTKAARPARARDPDKSAAGKVKSLTELQGEVKRTLLVERLAESGEEISVAARALNIGRSTLWEWRRDIEGFEVDLADAYRVGTEFLAGVARSRAVDGWEEPVFQQGKKIGTIRKYDHNLLQFVMRKRDPSYRDPKYATPVMAPQLPGQVSLDLDRMPAELLAQLEAEARRQAEERASEKSGAMAR